MEGLKGFQEDYTMTCKLVNSRTRVKISQAITGLLAQQPCSNTVNMIEQDC